MNSRAFFRWHILLLAAGLGLASLACSLDLGGPSPPAPLTQVKPKAAATLGSAWESAVLNAVDQEVTVIVDEKQLTAYLALRMQDIEAPISVSPQIFLRDGLMRIYGLTSRGPFQASFLIAISPEVDSDGNISFDLVEAKLGPMAAPAVLRNSISAILTEAFTGKLGPMATGIRINTIAISDGEMAIVGKLR
jgi:hypothetical protein